MIGIAQKLAKINLKINIIPDGLEQYVRFNINYQLVVIDNVQFFKLFIRYFS